MNDIKNHCYRGKNKEYENNYRNLSLKKKKYPLFSNTKQFVFFKIFFDRLQSPKASCDGKLE